MNNIANFVTSPFGVFLFCLAIILSTVYIYYKFLKELKPIKEQLQRAVLVIGKLSSEEKFAIHFDEFEREIKKISILKQVWHEFSETLIIDPQLNPPAILNTETAAHFFTRNSLIGSRLNLRFYSSFPNLLTGLGILGTFIGLVCGIWLASHGLSSSNAEHAKQALEKLLNGASLAFWTSIVGLITSMVFSWVEKNKVHQLDQIRHKWIDLLDGNLKRITSESINSQILAQANQQTTVLEQFTGDLAFQIADAFEQKVSGTLEPLLISLVEKVEQLSTSQKESAAQSTSDLVSAIEPLLSRVANSTEKMREDQKQDNHEMLQGLLDDFSSSLLGAAGEELSALGETIQGLSSQLDIQVNSLSKQHSDIQSVTNSHVENMVKQQGVMQDTAEKHAEEMNTIFLDRTSQFHNEINKTVETITNQQKSMQEMSKKQSEEMHSILSEGIAKFQKEITSSLSLVNSNLRDIVKDSSLLLEKTSEKFGNLFTTVSSQLNESLSKWDDISQNINLIFEKTQGFVSQIEILSESLLDSQDKMSSMMTPFENTATHIAAVTNEIVLVSSALNKNIEGLNSSQLEMKNIWINHEKRFEDIDDSLANTFQEIEAGLSRYTIIVKDFVHDLDKHSSSIASDLAGANSELREAIEDFTEALATNKQTA